MNPAINRSPFSFHRIRCCQLPSFLMSTNPISHTLSPRHIPNHHHPRCACIPNQLPFLSPIALIYYDSLRLLRVPNSLGYLVWSRRRLALSPRFCDRTSFARAISNSLVAPVTRQFTNLKPRFSQILHYFKPSLNPKYLVSHLKLCICRHHVNFPRPSLHRQLHARVSGSDTPGPTPQMPHN